MPLVRVSPGGRAAPQGFAGEGIRWELCANDAVEFGDIRQDGGIIDLWLAGREPRRNDSCIRLVGIETRKDLRRALSHLMSPVPLQEEHSDWPPAIRQAIAERRVTEGMTQEQVLCVVCQPLRREQREQNRARIETWFLPEGIEVRIDPQSRARSDTLRFVNGRLVSRQFPKQRAAGWASMLPELAVRGRNR